MTSTLQPLQRTMLHPQHYSQTYSPPQQQQQEQQQQPPSQQLDLSSPEHEQDEFNYDLSSSSPPHIAAAAENHMGLPSPSFPMLTSSSSSSPSSSSATTNAVPSHQVSAPGQVPGGDYLPRKLAIDTTVIRNAGDYAGHPSAPPSTASSYFPPPPLLHSANGLGLSPTRRRRGDHLLAPIPMNVSPFFKPTKQVYNIFSLDRCQPITLRIIPKVDRGFFLADSDWTCYRRNYFQVSSSFSAQDGIGREVELPCYLEMDKNYYTVTGFAIGLSARVANGEKKIDIVQHTPKRDKGPQLVPTPRPVRSGGNPHQYNGIGTNQLVATFERLQFKTATANNGKRRAAQQYYILTMELYTILENGQQIKVATTESAPLVVRGRSPGHYADGNLDALRIPGFPMGMDLPFARRPDMSPYPMYSPATPALTSGSGSPSIPLPSPRFAQPSPLASGCMSAPCSHPGFDFGYRHGNGMYRMPSADGVLMNGAGANAAAAAWGRGRAHSLAESDCSYTTTGTGVTASSYDSIDFRELDGTAMGMAPGVGASPEGMYHANDGGAGAYPLHGQQQGITSYHHQGPMHAHLGSAMNGEANHGQGTYGQGEQPHSASPTIPSASSSSLSPSSPVTQSPPHQTQQQHGHPHQQHHENMGIQHIVTNEYRKPYPYRFEEYDKDYRGPMTPVTPGTELSKMMGGLGFGVRDVGAMY